MATWISPGHNELTYLQNFELHKKRLGEVAKVLEDNDIRLGLEFVGPRTSRQRYRFAFHLHSARYDGAGRGNRHAKRGASAG